MHYVKYFYPYILNQGHSKYLMAVMVVVVGVIMLLCLLLVSPLPSAQVLG